MVKKMRKTMISMFLMMLILVGGCSNNSETSNSTDNGIGIKDKKWAQYFQA